MKDKKRTIITGVGRYTDHPDRPRHYYRLEEALSFVEAHVTHPELYQDIKNLLSDVRLPSYSGIGFKINPKHLLFRFVIFDTHGCMGVEAGQQRARHTAWLGPLSVTKFYFKVTEDGLIADILEERPNMNPASEIPLQHFAAPAYEVNRPCGTTM